MKSILEGLHSGLHDAEECVNNWKNKIAEITQIEEGEKRYGSAPVHLQESCSQTPGTN